MALTRNACKNILRLLASQNERNASLALQLLDSQQARQDFLATLGAQLLTTEGEARTQIQHFLSALLKAMGSNRWIQKSPPFLLADFGKKENLEAETEQAIKALHQVFGIDPLLLALYAFDQKGLCGAMILQQGSSTDIHRLIESRLYEGKKGKTLALQGLKMERLPEELSAFQDIEALDLSGNQLSRIPLSLLAFPRLRHLNVQYNPLNHLPKHLLGMPQLECLDLRHVKMRMSWLDYLQHPQKKRFLVSLRTEKGLSLNELHTDDANLLLANFTYESHMGPVLALAGQQLREVPEAVFHMRNLGVLDLRDNPLPMLPAWLLRMPQLMGIYCDYGTEYNHGLKQDGLEVFRDSPAPLPPPLAEKAARPSLRYNPVKLPLDLKLPEDLATL